MRSLPRVVSAALVFTGLACGGDPYTAAMEERAQAQEELVRILQTIKDPATMKAASETLSQSYERLAQSNARMNRLRPPSLEAKERLAQKFGARLQTAVADSLREIRRISDLPGGQEFIDKLKDLK